jgi:hypothetical protein
LTSLNRASLLLDGSNCCVLAFKSASAQSGRDAADILDKTNGDFPMMFLHARCGNAGPLGKPIPTRPVAAFLFARLHLLRHRRSG